MHEIIFYEEEVNIYSKQTFLVIYLLKFWYIYDIFRNILLHNFIYGVPVKTFNNYKYFLTFLNILFIAKFFTRNWNYCTYYSFEATNNKILMILYYMSMSILTIVPLYMKFIKPKKHHAFFFTLNKNLKLLMLYMKY